MIRTKHTLSLIALVPLAIVGCSSQPLAPSASTGNVEKSAVSTPLQRATASTTAANGLRPARGVVYVTSQGLYYDTFVARDPLPMQGKFQLLVDGATEFGPGQPGYLGGRWWEDSNGNGVQDEGDHFFLCPLLPPGRSTP